jgi:heme-degrading monooxygenase HmoA
MKASPKWETKKLKGKRIKKAIGRLWHGVASKHHLPRILEHLSVTRLRGSLDAKGNLGGVLLSRESNGAAELFVLTLWDSEEAIRGFVGANFYAPAYRPGDEGYVVSPEPTVKYFDAQILKFEENPDCGAELVDSSSTV